MPGTRRSPTYGCMVRRTSDRWTGCIPGSTIQDLTHLLERLEQMCIQHFLPVGTIEAVDERVLIWLARLDVVQIDLPLQSG